MSRDFKILLVFLFAAILLLMSIVLPRFGSYPPRRIFEAKNFLSSFMTALSIFRVDCGRYPTTEEGLHALIERPAGIPAEKWRDRYLDADKIPSDPWGHPFAYVFPGRYNTNGYDVFSLGPNGLGGNEAIGNWTPPTH